MRKSPASSDLSEPGRCLIRRFNGRGYASLLMPMLYTVPSQETPVPSEPNVSRRRCGM